MKGNPVHVVLRLFRNVTTLFVFLIAPLNAEAAGTILTVTGEITPSESGPVTFDLERLQSLPSVQFTTSTIWTDGAHEFTGVELGTLIDALGATGQTLNATAINDYAVEIPVSDATVGGPIIAFLMDGKPMSVRDKGPLWIVYPYDQNPDYQTELIYSRSIWQLDRIEVLP